MSDNNKDAEQIIYKASLKEIDGKQRVVFERNSSHIPTLAYVYKQLDYDITELQAIAKAKQEQNKIIKAGTGIIQQLRGKKFKR